LSEDLMIFEKIVPASLINDVWIAACCMSVGGTLLTRDRHFEQVSQIDKIILPQFQFLSNQTN